MKLSVRLTAPIALDWWCAHWSGGVLVSSVTNNYDLRADSGPAYHNAAERGSSYRKSYRCRIQLGVKRG